MSTNTYSTLAGLPAASSNTGNIALVTSNGVQYISDGEKWKSQGEFTTGTIESLQLDDLSFNGVLTSFPLKVNNSNVFPHLTTNVIIVVNGNTLKPGRDFNFIKSATSTNISFTNSDNTPKAYPSGTIFYGLVFSRLPIDNNNALQTSGGTMIGDITFSSNQTFPSSGIANATTSQAGIVSLSSSTGSTSESVAATSKAVKDTKDAADAAASTANASLPKSGGTMTGNITFNSTQQFDGRDVSADGAKLDGIEASATADQTAAEIRTLVESANDSNVFTDADHTKLNGIESGATGDQTNAEIRAAVEAASDSNVFTDADHTKLDGIESGATADQTDEEIQDIVGAMLSGNTESGITVTYQDSDGTIDFSVASQTDNNFTNADHTKLDGIEAGATADQTNSEIKTAYEANSDTNAFTDADHTKLDGIEASANNYSISSDLLDEDNMSSNSATKVPSQQSVKAYVDAEVAGVVDSAPGALNTLNELAAALGDDENFATTTTNNLAAKLPKAGGQMTGNITFSGTQTVDGRDLSVDGAKLDGIEAGATGDQTNAEIRAAVEAASDSNVFTDADHTKLNGIESNATADQTAAEIRALVESASDSNVFTDADHSKLNGIEASATADQTASEIKTAYESNSNTNAFTDADHSKLDGIAAGAEVNVNADWNSSSGDSQILNKPTLVSALNDLSDVSAANPSTNQIIKWNGSSWALASDNSGSGGSNIGGSNGVDFNDNVKARFGTGNDLELYHDGTNTLITNATGVFVVKGDDYRIKSYSTDEEMIHAHVNGAVELYYDNSKKFETLSTGTRTSGNVQLPFVNNSTGLRNKLQWVTEANYFDEVAYIGVNRTAVSGAPSDMVFATGTVGSVSERLKINSSGNVQIPNDSGKLQLGASQDLQIYHDGSSSIIRNYNTSTPIYIQPADSETGIKLTANGSTELYYDNTKKLSTASNGVTLNDGLLLDNATNAGRDVQWQPASDRLAFLDNTKATFGDSVDLQIYHDGNHSRIDDGGTGSLLLQTNGTSIQLNKGTSENMLVAYPDGAVELYYNGSRKLHTRSDAVNVIGDLDMTDADGYKINLGVSSDLQIYHDGSHSYIEDSGTGVLHIATSSFQVVNAAKNEFMIKAPENGGVELYYDNSLKLDVKSWGVEINGHLGLDDNYKLALGNGPDLEIYHNGSHSYIQDVGTGTLRIQSSQMNVLKADGSETMATFVADAEVALFYNNSKKFETFASGTITSGNHQVNGTCYPGSNNSYDLGTNASRWRNIYTNDLNLSNQGSSNDVDGTWGDWTIQEGENDLFLKNNRSGKKYKFNLTEVS